MTNHIPRSARNWLTASAVALQWCATTIAMLAHPEAVAQMAIPGKFEVTTIGAANYTIPIQVPPGIAGMEPKLALNYNSRGGNGLLGVGWTLAGLPAITRCPRTTPQDGVKGAVSYNADDRFCLGDGKRLMVVSGTYGAAGSSYRTETESFANVTAFGSQGSGPQYFIVKTKDGRTMEFGNSLDSRITVAGQTTVRTWALNKMADAVHNTLSIVYALPDSVASSASEYNSYPLRIDYTSNSATELAAANSVEFAYASRPDPIHSYRGGFPFRTSVRLSSITTKTNGSAVSIYTPTYTAGSGGRSTITAISQCAASGPCAAVTRFEIGGVSGSLWPLPAASIVPITATESSSSGGHWLSLDVNHDGLTDLIHFTELSGAYRVWFSNGDGTFTIREWTTSVYTSLSGGAWRVLDIDGNGQADLVHMTATPGLMYVWKSNGDGTFAITSFTNSSDTALTNGSWQTIDVNGDGLGDLVHLTTNAGDMRVWKSNGDGTFAISQFLNSTDTNLGGQWHVMDMDGDGLADLFHLTRHSTGWASAATVWRSNGEGTFSVAQTRLFVIFESLRSHQEKSMQMDVNGDGLQDLVVNWYAGNYWVLTSRGDGTFEFTEHRRSNYGNEPADGTWQVVDANGDGLSDLIHTPANLSTGWSWVWYSNGDGTFTVTVDSQAIDTCSAYCTTMRAGDFMGTGAPGFVHVNGNTVKSAWFLSRQPANVVTAVADGLGGRTSWSLSPLPAMRVRGSYVKDLPSDSTTTTVISAIPVVESVRTNTGLVHDPEETWMDRSVYYRYGSARVERNGRGFLGFSWRETEDAVTGLRARTQFRHDFPYTGHESFSGVGTGGSWNNLSLTTTQYGCTMLDGGSTCTVAPGNRYFVYPAQIDSQSTDLDGTPMPRRRVVNADPDLFGNIGTTTSTLFNADGSPTEHSKKVSNTYYNDPANWILGRLVKSVVTSTSPTVPGPVVPGSDGLPVPPPPLSKEAQAALLMTIFNLLLSDD